MSKAEPFPNEAALVAAFVAAVQGTNNPRNSWTIYPETAGWDLVLVHETGVQLGLEAKLSLNAKVIDQALSQQHATYGQDGPDYRGVLVPHGKTQLHLGRICAAIGIKVIEFAVPERHYRQHVDLPQPESPYERWPRWCPSTRLILPDYVPDVSAGKASPVQLTTWKIKAIKLMIVLEKQGYVTRADMRLLDISPTRWTDGHQGYLAREGAGRFVKCNLTPDLRAQHPTNYAEIEADVSEWGKCFDPFKAESPQWLLPLTPGEKA